MVLRGYASMAAELAGAQWNEGDVFCSVVRRVALPDAFFAIDGQTETFLTVLDEFGAYPAVIQRELDRYLPFLATTRILIAAVRAGMGREAAHEIIKENAVAVALAMREKGAEPDLLDRLAADRRLPLDRRRAGCGAGRQAGVHRRGGQPGRRRRRGGRRTGEPLSRGGEVHLGRDPVTLAGPCPGSTSPIWTTSPTVFPHDLFDVHRREAPVYWHEPTDNTPDGEGFWSVATYAETLAVLRDPETYSSVTGGERPYGGTLLQDLAIAGQVLNMMDDPRHSQIRRLVSSGLTPRMIRRVEDDLRAPHPAAAGCASSPATPFDFLVDVAAELPMQMICILLGVPESERHWLFEAIEPQFDFGGSRKASMAQMTAEEAGTRMYTYGQELIAAKRAEPTDDMLSVVANATLDDADAALSDLELYLFFSLLFSAGAETTRNAVAGGLLALAEHPDQLALLRADLSLLPTAVEEMVRWTSPSPSKRRTATRDVELGGCAIEAGQKVQIWEGSANRDAVGVRRRRRLRHRAKAEPALGFRAGNPLLPWRQPGPAGAAGAVRGTARPVLVGPGGQAGGVDAQQQAHRHSPPHRRTGSVRPDAFAAVMATGIVSIAAADHGYLVISDGCRWPAVAAGNWRASRRPGWRYVAADSGYVLGRSLCLALAICV